MDYYTGNFQGHIPIFSEDIAEAEVIEAYKPAKDIAVLLFNILGNREWKVVARHKEDSNLNYIVYRP